MQGNIKLLIVVNSAEELNIQKGIKTVTYLKHLIYYLDNINY